MQGSNGNTTRERILVCAADLFAEKGFTETTIREIAEAVGVKGSSIYNHFVSKNMILEHMLREYSSYNTDVFQDKDIYGILKNDPTPNGVLSCLQLAFPPTKQTYFLKVLCVMLQEQFRNPIVRGYMAEHYILRSEKNIATIIGVLKQLGVIREDADPDYWIKADSGLFYTFAARMMLGIGDSAPGYTGKSMGDMLRYTFELLFTMYGTEKARSAALSGDGGS